jgi:hypothetical protein
MPNTPILDIPLLANSQPNKFESINDVFHLIDSISIPQTHPTPITSVPVSPVDGMFYLIATGGSGILAGNGGNVLFYTEVGTVPNIVEIPSGVVLGNYYSDGTNWKNDILKDGVITLVTSTTTIAVPNTPFQHYQILVQPTFTLTLTSALVLVGASLVLGSGFYDVIVDGTNIFVR